MTVAAQLLKLGFSTEDARGHMRLLLHEYKRLRSVRSLYTDQVKARLAVASRRQITPGAIKQDLVSGRFSR